MNTFRHPLLQQINAEIQKVILVVFLDELTIVILWEEADLEVLRIHFRVELEMNLKLKNFLITLQPRSAHSHIYFIQRL